MANTSRATKVETDEEWSRVATKVRCADGHYRDHDLSTESNRHTQANRERPPNSTYVIDPLVPKESAN